MTNNMKYNRYSISIRHALMLLVLLLGLPSLGYAESFEQDGVKYSVVDDATGRKCVEVAGLSEASRVVVIPRSVRNYEVIAIGNKAFYDCSSLESITIPEGVTSIKDFAFYCCSSLKSITIPEGVTSIGKQVFYGCSSLTSITIPEGVTSIGIGVFGWCSSLTSITIPEGVTSIGSSAFWKCSSLTSITIPEGVTSIGGWTFSECSSLTSITIPEGVTSIGEQAFYGCSSLKSITIPEGVTSIGEQAFDGCWSLTSITIPEGVTSIGKLAFANCSSLTSITIPEGVTSIGERAFKDCPKLVYVFLQQIDPQFRKLEEMSENTLFVVSPNTVATYKAWWPERADQIRYLETASSEHRLMLKKDATTKIINTDLDINKCIKAVSSNPNVITIDEAGNIKATGEGNATIDFIFAPSDDVHNILAQYEVTVFDEVSFNKSRIFLKIGEEQQLKINSSIDLSAYAQFETTNAAVTTVDESGKVTAKSNGVANILYRAKDSGDTLATCKVVVYQKHEDVVYVGGIYYTLNGDKKEASVTNVLNGRLVGDSINNNPPCYSATINIPKKVTYDGVVYNVTAIGEYAFSGQEDLLSVYIPSSVVTIKPYAFAQAKKLKAVRVEDGSHMVNVGDHAFSECSSLLSYAYDGSANFMRSIDDYAFYKCPVLNKVVLPDSVTSVGNSAFRYCEKLKNIQLSKNLNIINEYAFGECGFSKIVLPEALASIQAAAFINNSHLTDITIPARLEGIGASAFENNSMLNTVTFNTTIYTMTINNDAFKRCPALTKVNIVNLRSWAQTNFSNTEANPASTAHHLYMEGNEVIDAKLPYGTRFINNNAFNGCTSIKTIEIPETVETVAENIFLGCSALNKVYCYADVPPMYIGGADPAEMNDVFKNATLYVPTGKKNDYSNDDWNYWNRFNNIKTCNKPIPNIEATSVEMDKKEAMLYIGDTMTLIATVLPSNTTNPTLSWVSNNPAVATVSSQGVVTAVGIGEAVITATTSDGSNLKASCTIHVNKVVGINEVTIDATKKDVVFRLDGVRVYDKHLKPGIYIVNGHKVMVK